MKLPAWLTPFRRKDTERRFSQDDWAQMFSFNGNTYPIGQYGTITRGARSELIPNNFEAYVEGAYKQSGIVFAAMTARHLIFSEARLLYQALHDGKPGDTFWAAELKVLEKPWPNGTTGELLYRAIQDADMAGNNYVLREGVGPMMRLRRLRPDWVEILLTAAPDEAVKSDVAAYLYKPGGTENPDLWEIYPIDGSKGTVAHWSPFPDPIAQYRGMSPLTPVVREIMADKAASDHKARFFENAATPNLAVSFKDTVTDEQFKKFMEAMNETKHGVEHAYETLYLGGGADVTVVGSHIAQMDFKGTQGHGEERICAALGIHPLIVGTSGGFSREPLSQESLTAAKDLLADKTMRPLWRSLCTAYEPLVAEYTNARLWYDDHDIAFLRQDRQQVANIRNLESTTLGQYIMAGFTPDSSILAIKHNDITLLEHTGLYSVQLQPPLTQQPGDDSNTPDAIDDTKEPNTEPSDPAEGEG
jgi:phage portal protein BeeE